MDSSENNYVQSIFLEFNNYKSLVSAELELIQRVFEIRQNFSNSCDSERLVEPILKRILKIKSEKLIFEQKFDLILLS